MLWIVFKFIFVFSSSIAQRIFKSILYLVDLPQTAKCAHLILKEHTVLHTEELSVSLAFFFIHRKKYFQAMLWHSYFLKIKTHLWGSVGFLNRHVYQIGADSQDQAHKVSLGQQSEFSSLTSWSNHPLVLKVDMAHKPGIHIPDWTNVSNMLIHHRYSFLLPLSDV